MKVGSKFYTEDGKDAFYPRKKIEITKITEKRVEYTYSNIYGIFSRRLDELLIKDLQELSLVMELFYE